MGKKLIVYYPYTNNTKKIAEQIQIATGTDICEIETVNSFYKHCIIKFFNYAVFAFVSRFNRYLYLSMIDRFYL